MNKDDFLELLKKYQFCIYQRLNSNKSNSLPIKLFTSENCQVFYNKKTFIFKEKYHKNKRISDTVAIQIQSIKEGKIENKKLFTVVGYIKSESVISNTPKIFQFEFFQSVELN